MASAQSGTLYRGREGMWSWVAHRISGMLIFLFLLVHVLDTALVRVSPEAYNEVIGHYKTVVFGLGEVGLVGAILFHALNGLRIILVDFLVPGHQAPARHVLGRGGRVGRAHGRLPPPPPHAHVRSVIPMTSTTSIPDPSTRYRRTGQRGLNSEMLSWMFMRASGVLLVILVFGHLFVNLWLGQGVKGIDFAFVGGKWASPFWQVWDLLMLWLGLLHGGNGVRTIINDYARGDRPPGPQGPALLRRVVTIILGTW